MFESISVDGYSTEANGDMRWAHAGREDDEFAGVSRKARPPASCCAGAKMEAFWPTPMAAQQMPVVAKGMNAARKYVASRTIHPTWNNTHLLKGELPKAVENLKSDDGPDITVLGSGSVAAHNSARPASSTNTSS